tara:strand:+ start:133 stop:1392 length:1260 start_codon:yes stop_codon:yes gene_type:complete
MAYQPWKPKTVAEIMQMMTQGAQQPGLNTQTPGYFGQINMPVQTGPGSGYNPRNILPNPPPQQQPANVTPKNQKAAIIMGALSDIFRGQDTTQNTVLRQQQMVAMQERAKQQQAMQKLRDGQPFTQADMLDIMGAKDYLTATMGSNKDSTLMKNTGFISELYEKRDALPADKEFDPQREQYNIAIRNAEAGIGAYKYDPTRQFDITEQKRIAGSQGGLDLTPIEKTIDENFAKEAAEYILKNKAQVKANLLNLGEKIKILEAGDQNVSGPEIGLTPEILAPILIPDAVAFEDDVRDVVFQSLREKLGAQFTEREGDRLVAAAFNKSLPEEVNIARLRRLYGTIEDAALAKESGIEFYNKNSTIKGYQATPLVFDSIMNKLINSTDFESLSDEQLLKVYQSNDTTDEERDVIESIVKSRD